MLRAIRCWLLFSLLPLSLGCAMCPGTDDYTYAAFGGRWQRDDYVHGRVASAFEPAGGYVVTAPITENEPTPATEADEPADLSAESTWGPALGEPSRLR